MKRVVETGLKRPNAPIEWATVADGILYTALIAMRPDGTLETGDIRAQARVTFENLKRVVEAAGGTLDDVTQVLIFLRDYHGDVAGMNEVYKEFFAEPYPSRACLDANPSPPEARIEIVAYAHVGNT